MRALGNPLDAVRTGWSSLPPSTRTWVVVGGVGLALGAVIFRQRAKNLFDCCPVLRPGGPFPRYDFSDLHPEFRPAAEQWRAQLAREGIEVGITSTMRTPAMQDALYAEGRAGLDEVNRLRRIAGMFLKSCCVDKILTYARGGDLDRWSTHQVGLAFDFKVKDPRTGAWYGDPRSTGVVPPEWRRAGELGEQFGMRWGERWTSPYDPVHLQWIPTGKAPDYLVRAYLAGRLPETSTAQARALAGTLFSATGDLRYGVYCDGDAGLGTRYAC